MCPRCLIQSASNTLPLLGMIGGMLGMGLLMARQCLCRVLFKVRVQLSAPPRLIARLRQQL